MAGSLVLVVPGRLDARTGGSLYNRHMAEGLRRLGWQVDVRELEGDFPRPDAAALEQAARVFAALPQGATVVVDGMALSAMPDIAARESARLRLVALVHLPIAADVGLDTDTAARFEASERRALQSARLIAVTGRAGLSLLDRYAIEVERVQVVEPGTHPAPLARGSSDAAVHLLCVATLNPGKGHDVLLRALASMDVPTWRLTCAGSLTRHPETAARVQTLARELGLDHRVSFVGDLETESLERCYDAADLFVLATLRETYGMAVAEALAHGLPVIGTSTGAIPSLVGTDAGLIVPPGDVESLTGALARAIGDAQLRAWLAAGARRVREQLPTWDDAARRMAAALEGWTRHG
ncbi:MAG: glycosyltransferase family 4 protein [Acidobacteria bacterium]|nr:glycosyltransferase family 4 protein [Acidobacteriota bacterium]